MEWLRIIAGVGPTIGAAATVYLAWRAKHQTELAKMQLQEMHDARIEATRPLLELEVYLSEFLSSENPEEDGLMLVMIRLRNKGRTKATNVTFDLTPEAFLSAAEAIETTNLSMATEVLRGGVSSVEPLDWDDNFPSHRETFTWDWARNLNQAIHVLPEDEKGNRFVLIRVSWQIGDTDKEGSLRHRVTFPLPEESDRRKEQDDEGN